MFSILVRDTPRARAAWSWRRWKLRRWRPAEREAAASAIVKRVVEEKMSDWKEEVDGELMEVEVEMEEDKLGFLDDEDESSVVESSDMSLLSCSSYVNVCQYIKN